jgi:hypothetical protein
MRQVDDRRETIMSRVREVAEDVDEAVSEALLSGQIDPDVEMSSATADLARLLAEVRTVDRSEPLAGEQAIRVLYRREFKGSTASSDNAPIPLYGSKSSRRLARRAAALGAVLALGASGVAAAAGALPDPVQRRVHDTLAMVGISVPDGRPGADHPSGPGTESHPGSTAVESTPSGPLRNQRSGETDSPRHRFTPLPVLPNCRLPRTHR